MGKAATRREVTALQHGRQVIQNLRARRIRWVFFLNDMHPGEQYHQDAPRQSWGWCCFVAWALGEASNVTVPTPSF